MTVRTESNPHVVPVRQHVVNCPRCGDWARTNHPELAEQLDRGHVCEVTA